MTAVKRAGRGSLIGNQLGRTPMSPRMPCSGSAALPARFLQYPHSRINTRRATREYRRTGLVFKPYEPPTLLGSPANPGHPASHRLGYFAIGCLVRLTGGLGNALVTVNLNFAQGTLGLYGNESAWLTARIS
jgi:hypothetical protein